MNNFRALKKILVPAIFLSASFSAAQTITGTVHNQTTGKPSAGDEVVLLRLTSGMLEESHTKTDGQGAFTLNVQFADVPHIVRVLHQGVNYDQSITSNAAPDIKVFDAAAKVQGVDGYIDIVKVESDGKNFSVTELHAVENVSNPPRTQASPRNFEVSLPAKAQMDSVMVAGPSGIAVKETPEPVAGQAGRYSIGFPLRPGMTKYWVKYHLPYGDHMIFHSLLPYPTRQFSVQYPNSMTFTSSKASGFHPIIDQQGMKVEAISQAKAGPIPQFELSGIGILPPDSTFSKKSQAPTPSRPPTVGPGESTQAQIPAGQRGTTPAQKSTAILWAWVAAGVAVAGLAAFVLWRVRSAKQRAAREALKEKLFELENARLRGTISAEEYAATKQVLNSNLEQVVARGSGE
jgi:hypothetical protein